MFVAIGCTAAAALGLGGLLPLLSITMERLGVPSEIIGLNAATPFLAALVIMPLVPKMMAKMKTAWLLGGAALFSAFITLVYGLSDNIYFWFSVRFVNGIALGVLFAVSEAWINHYAPEHMRGRMIGVYVTALGGCFALGPFVLWIAGTEGLLPFAFCAALILLASLPVLWGLNLPEGFRHQEDQPHEKFRKFFFLAPTLALAGIIYGAIEVLVVTFIPVYGIRLGFSEQLAAITLSAFALGSICCQIPLGIIADKLGRRRILNLCSVTATSAMIFLAISFSFLQPTSALGISVLCGSLFIFGASAVGIYTMAMAEMGERFKGAALASANAALLFCYNLGSFSTPTFSGAVMDAAPIAGLPLFLAALCFSALVPALWRKVR